MSDFITRLAQRQLGQIASVMPRLPEVFAPSSPFAPFPTAAPGSIVEAIAAAAPARRQDDFTATAAAHTLFQRAAAVAVPDATPKSGPVEAPQGIAAPRNADTSVSEAALAPSSVKNLNPEPVPLVLPMPTTPFTVERPFYSEPSDSLNDQAVAPVMTSAQRNDPPPHRVAAEHSVPLLAPARLEVKRSKQNEAFAPARRVADNEPPIHVTIGRIEVTALTQAPPAKRTPAPRKPAMSLDDYLTRRRRRES